MTRKGRKMDCLVSHISKWKSNIIFRHPDKLPPLHETNLIPQRVFLAICILYMWVNMRIFVFQFKERIGDLLRPHHDDYTLRKWLKGMILSLHSHPLSESHLSQHREIEKRSSSSAPEYHKPPLSVIFTCIVYFS